MRSSIFCVLIIAIFLSGCVSRDQAKLGSGQNIQIDKSNSSNSSFSSDPSALDKAGLRNINLSGENLAPDLKIERSEGAEGSDLSARPDPSVVVASARLIPIADKEGKSIVGWRMVGEIANTGSSRVDGGEMVVSLVTAETKESRTIIPDEVQPGGFMPLLAGSPRGEAGERGLYDVLVSNPEASESLTIGFRSKTPSPSRGDLEDKIRLEVQDLEFVRQTEGSDLAERSDPSIKFLVRGKLANSLNVPVKDLIVRFWAVVTVDGKEEVAAVGTWRREQDVMESGKSRKFEVELVPLTVRDKELLSQGKAGSPREAGSPGGEAGLSAMGMGRRLE